MSPIWPEKLSTATPSLAALDPSSLPEVPADTRIGPCVAGVGKFICIGLNYSDHAAETGAQVPPEPVIFNKWTSAICGPNDEVIIPRDSEKTDWEVELGVVIGKAGRYIVEADAMQHVAGFCVINDVSEREFQPGDVISTGPPPGVGMGQQPPVYLKPGQRMRLGIQGLGEQQQTVVADQKR